jgi:hypothetical protein
LKRRRTARRRRAAHRKVRPKPKFCMLCHRERDCNPCEKCRRPTIPNDRIRRFPRLAPKPKAKPKKFYCDRCGRLQETSKCLAHGTVNEPLTDSLKHWLQTTTGLGSARRPYQAGLPS